MCFYFRGMTHIPLIVVPACVILTGCEYFYDPSRSEDAPPTRATEMIQPFEYTETFSNPYTAEDLSKSLSLSELLDIALFNNPSTRASWYAARAAAFGYHVSLSSYYPTISYFGNYTAQRSNGNISVNTAQGTAASSAGTGSTGGATGPLVTVTTTLFNEFSLSYLLLDFGGRDAQANLAWQLLLAANWQHDLVMQQVMLSVLDAYTSYEGNKALVEADEQNLKDAQVALEAALKMQKAGLATKTDVLSSQSALEQARFNLEQAKGAEKTALGQLLIALGLPADTKLSVNDLPQKLPVVEIAGDITSLIALAKQKRPDIGAAIAAVLEQESQLQISYSAGMPTLNLQANSSRLVFLHPQRPSSFNNNISLNWSVPLFQGFYYVNQQKQIRAQIQEALANLDAKVAEVTLGVVTNYYAFTTAEAELPSSQAVLEFSERAFRGMLSQYKVGTSSIIDVLTALTTLSNARAQWAMTRTQWAAALANLAFSVGVLEDDSGQWEDNPPEKLYKIKYNDDVKP